MIPAVKAAIAIGIPVAGYFLFFKKKDTEPVEPSPATDPFDVPSKPAARPAASAPAAPTPVAKTQAELDQEFLGNRGTRILENTSADLGRAGASPFPERDVEPDAAGVLDGFFGLFSGGGTEVNVDGGLSSGFSEGGANRGGSSGGGGSSDGFDDDGGTSFFDFGFGDDDEDDADGGLSSGFSEG